MVTATDSATVPPPKALPLSPGLAGIGLGALGVLIFSFSFPGTKLALRGFDPWAVAFGRAVLAAALAAPILRLQRARYPRRGEWLRLAIVTGGVVVGFPALSSLALESSSSSHGAVVIALLPAATAVAAVLRTGERPSVAFWLAAAAGAAVVAGFVVARGGGALRLGDLYLLAAVVVCALGYAEGGLLARELGAAETICWALLLALPLTLPLALASAPAHMPSAAALTGFAYVGTGSMLLGFFAWYGGLARGGVARISQLQLAQTPLTLVWSALVLGERIGWATVAVALAVLVSVAATQQARIRPSD
jgi:drug/metabolite transporter (DMT)-like permease